MLRVRASGVGLGRGEDGWRQTSELPEREVAGEGSPAAQRPREGYCGFGASGSGTGRGIPGRRRLGRELLGEGVL